MGLTMKTTALVGLIVPILFLSSVEPALGCSTDPSTDYWGNDIASTQRSSPLDCCNDCTAQQGCIGYVWYHGTCWLKSQLVGKSYSPGATAGYLADMTAMCGSVQSNTDYPGNDIGSTRQADASQCCQDCSDNAQCAAYVWTAWAGGTCWLKSRVGVPVASPGAMAASTTRGQCGALQTNTDYWGNDVASTARAASSDCCADCVAHPQCVVFVHFGGMCYLKGQVGTRSTLAGAVASVVTSQCTSMEANMDYVGNDVGTTARGAAADCCADCAANAACTVVVWGGAFAMFVRGRAAPTKFPSPQAKFVYQKGWFTGSYNMVTSLQGCQTQPQATAGSIAPFHEELTMVFRGPLTIDAIAVFQPTNGAWTRTSSYRRASPASASNLVFLNNANPAKFTGGSPQGFATTDGLGFSPVAVPFSGTLQDASNPSDMHGGPGIATGAEVNILQPARCSADSCLGSFDPTFGLHGWAGSKMFVVQAQFGAGGVPAMWLLNAQVVRANQYGCNCRGMADPGGCGELDVAEAIYAGTSTLATHKYYLNAKPSPGHDAWTTRPVAAPATFVVILDEPSGTIAVQEFAGGDFDFFDVDALPAASVNALM
ncbi:Aste57867_11807 [Aphanomyces stellatus]|uniref:glucan endo-1,3-beta-D-glucosidase n=1 Tax=Aphanomyces stellatus TaxID=120398 RepID=A0A485KV52_9STRA|nr:hypothetical protein As57867_011762 [Aphanomyces stellatus]VFT88662.1 Aste57867_11807 [Aphanomyces stellatus]